MAVIPAAGTSKRMGTGVDKQLLSLCGQTVLERTIAAVAAAESITGIVLVVRAGEEDFFQRWSEGFGGIIKDIVPGGAQRQQSVRNGLNAVPSNTEIVVIHDGARPLVQTSLVDGVVKEAKRTGAATLGVPVKDTVKMTGESNQVVRTVPRDKLWLVQTPQAFRYEVICRAHQWAAAQGYSGTDDASLVEARGWPVSMVQGSYENIKVTTPEDIIVAEALLRARREK